MQLRMDHIPLAKYLFHIGKILSPMCPAFEETSETVHHFLLHCPAYQHARQTLCYNISGGTIHIECLLTKPKPMKVLVKYVATTK